MSDELPDVFRQVQPRRAPDELRQRVLAAVEPHLVRRKKPRWERTIELAVAASLALGVGLNVWLVRSDAAWRLRNFGPMPAAASAEMAQTATDPATGKWAGRPGPLFGAATYFARSPQYQQLLDELTGGKGRGAL